MTTDLHSAAIRNAAIASRSPALQAASAQSGVIDKVTQPAESAAPNPNAQVDGLRTVAEDFEAVFIAEMLTHAGFEKALSGDSGFGGEAFTGFLIETYAERLSASGGFGLADKIYNQLKSRTA